MEKLCIFCKHMEFDDGGTGEYADPASMTCQRGHWAGSKRTAWGSTITLYNGDNLGNYREIILTAGKCSDYEGPAD